MKTTLSALYAAACVAAVLSIGGISAARTDVEPNKGCLHEYVDANGHLIRTWTCKLAMDYAPPAAATPPRPLLPLPASASARKDGRNE